MTDTAERKFSLLRGKIAQYGLTYQQICDEIGIAQNSFGRKMSGKTQFKADEIRKLVTLLDIDPTQIADYFFE